MVTKDLRDEWILQLNDEIKCKNGDSYRITGTPVGYGGSSVLYPAEKIKNGADRIQYVIKECFPMNGKVDYIRRNGKITPTSAIKEDEREAAFQLRAREEAFRSECLFGQEVSRVSDRAIIAREVLEVCHIKTRGKEENVEDVIFLGMERKDKQGVFLSEIIKECKKPKKDGYPFRTGGLPNIYTTARIIEQVLKAVDLVHKAGNNGYLHGDIHDGNLYFGDFRPEESEEGDVGFGCLLDFGNVRELYVVEGNLLTEEITNREIFSTRGFMAPEIVNRNDGHLRLGREADLYSVGRLMLYLLTGEKHYDYEKNRDLVYSQSERKQLLEHQYRAVGCTRSAGAWVNQILKRVLENEPEHRYHSVQEMLEDVIQLVHMTRPPKNRLCLGLPVLSQDVFIGREKEIKKLTRRLKEGCNPIVLYGFGGIGKTELSIEFGRRMQVQQNRNVYFVRFEESFRKTVIGPIADAFSGYDKLDEKRKPKSEQVIFNEVMKLLGELDSGDILIIDNVDDAEKKFDELCNGDDEGEAFRSLLKCINIILTTRSEGYNHIEIEKMSDEDLVLLMRKFCPSYSKEQLLPLISEVDNHTLTVELCARTLAQSPLLTPIELCNILSKGDYSSKKLEKVSTVKDRDYERARIEVHLRKLFQIAELKPSERKLLSNALLLPISGMEISLFMKAVSQKKADSINHLIDRGWIKYDKANRNISIHPLINSICCKDKMTKPTVKRCKTYIWWIDSWIGKASESLLSTQYEQVAQCAYTFFKSDIKEPENQALLNALGHYYFLNGNYEKSIQYLAEAMDKSYCYNNLSMFVQASIGYSRTLETNRSGIDQAIQVLDRFEQDLVLKEYLNKNLEEQIDVLATYATLLRVNKRQKDAIKKCEQVIEMVEKNPEYSCSPYIAHAYFEISTCKYQLRKDVPGYLEEAERDAKEALRRHIEYYGVTGVEQANDYNTLGYIYKEQGDIEQSINCFQKMYNIRFQHYGEKNLYTTNALEGYALALSYDKNRKREAEEKYLKALQIKREIFPPNHPWIGESCQKVAKYYLRNAKWAEALEYATEALTIYLAQEAESKYDIGMAQYHVAQALCHLGRVEEARNYAQSALSNVKGNSNVTYIVKDIDIFLKKIDEMP